MVALAKKYYLVWLINDPKVDLPFWTGCQGKVVLWLSYQTEFAIQRFILKIKIKALENLIYFYVLKCYSKGIFQIKGLLFSISQKISIFKSILKIFYWIFFLNSLRFVNNNGFSITIFVKASNRA